MSAAHEGGRGPLAPVVLAPNQPDRPYRGGAGIARFRGSADAGDFAPEDFVGSMTEIFAGGGIGLSVLPDGRTVREAVMADPTAYLGEEHVARFGSHTELLVKLLDTGERLFVHFHPDGRFAERHLSLRHGKTEAWIVVATAEDARPSAWLGFQRDVSAEEIAGWVDRQDVDAMLAVMHELPLLVGTTILVPAGMPHAIGAGVTLVELQEPTDLSILLEYTGFDGVEESDAFLGLGRDVALGALDRVGRSADVMAGLVSELPSAAGVTRLLPPDAAVFFRADLVRVDPTVEGATSVVLEAGFAILVVIDGAGHLRGDGREAHVSKGDTVLVPFAAGRIELRGAVTAVICRPPAPASVRPTR